MTSMILRLGFFIGLIGGMAGCASTSASGEHDRNFDFSSIERVAVVAIEGAGASEAAQNQIGSMFNQRLMGKGYSPVERAQIRAVMDEQNFQQSDVTSPSNAAELGRIMNVDMVLLVNVPEYREKMSMSVQMVSTENAGIVWSASGSADTGGGLSEKAGALFGAAAGAAAGSEADGTRGAVAGGIAGAAAGDLAGESMTPRQQEQAAELIDELAKSLPDAG